MRAILLGCTFCISRDKSRTLWLLPFSLKLCFYIWRKKNYVFSSSFLEENMCGANYVHIFNHLMDLNP